jgi:hypothetical protein
MCISLVYVVYLFKIIFSNIWLCQVHFDISKITSDVSKAGLRLFIMVQIQALARYISLIQNTQTCSESFYLKIISTFRFAWYWCYSSTECRNEKDEEGSSRRLLSHITSVSELRMRKNMKTCQKGYLDSGPKIWIQNLPTMKKLWYSFDRNIRSNYVNFQNRHSKFTLVGCRGECFARRSNLQSDPHTYVDTRAHASSRHTHTKTSKTPHFQGKNFWDFTCNASGFDTIPNVTHF